MYFVSFTETQKELSEFHGFIILGHRELWLFYLTEPLQTIAKKTIVLSVLGLQGEVLALIFLYLAVKHRLRWTCHSLTGAAAQRPIGPSYSEPLRANKAALVMNDEGAIWPMYSAVTDHIIYRPIRKTDKQPSLLWQHSSVTGPWHSYWYP